MPTLAKRHGPILALGLVAAAAYSVYAVQRHLRFETGRDLAIFDQALWHYSRLETPESSIVGLPNLLGDHFHPLLVVLAPLYALVSKPETLLVAQSVLIAAAVVPIFLFARDRVGATAAYAFAASYVVFWGVQAAAGYEFHEVAFAPVLLAAAIHLATRQRWLPLYGTLAALLLVKEDLAIAVAFFGLWMALGGERRRGAAVAAVALSWYTLVTEVLIPHFAGGRDFRHWSFTDFGDSLPSSVLHVLGHPWEPFVTLVDDAQKVETLAYLLIPFLCLTLLSRLAVLLIPFVAERMLSSTELFWGTDFHYSLAIAPVLVMGAAAGLDNLTRWWPAGVRFARGPVAVATVVLALNVVAAVSVFDGRRHPLATIFQPSYYREPAGTDAIERALAAVPADDDVSVATHDQLMPHLSQRDSTIGLASTAGRVDYVLANVVQPYGVTAGNRNFRELGNAFVKLAPHYEPVFFEAGWTVLRLRDRAPGAPSPLGGLGEDLHGRLITSSRTWGEAAVRLGRALESCRVDATRCLPALTGFREAGTGLRVVLRRIAAGAPGDCPALAGYALQALGRLDQRTAAIAAGAPDAVAVLEAEVGFRDLPGVVLRPAVICSR